MDLDADEIDSVSGLTHEQRYANFLKIVETVQYLDKGGKGDADWIEDQIGLIMQYRSWISDYSMVNQEIEDVEFRKCCSDTETLLRHLVHAIITKKTFDIKVYHIFMKHMKQIVDSIATEDEMEEMMKMLSVK